ncbi:MAG: hypothetical protein WC637_15150, partial [Victivallales bacterium]
MSLITLRGLTAGAVKKVRRRATLENKSMNRFIVDLIEKDVLGQGAGKPQEYSDLDDLIGSMNEADVRAIEKSVSKQR